MTEQIFWLAMFGISAFALGYLFADHLAARRLEAIRQLVDDLIDSLAHGDVPAIPAGFSSEHSAANKS